MTLQTAPKVMNRIAEKLDANDVLCFLRAHACAN